MTATENHLRLALLGWATAFCVSVAASALSAANGRPPEVFLPIGISGIVIGSAAAILVYRRPDNPIAAMLLVLAIGSTALVVLRYLFPVLAPLNVAFGAQINLLPLAYVVLSFPSGHLAERSARWVWGAAVLITALGGAAELVSIEPKLALPYASCTPCTGNPVRILDPSFYPLFQDINASAFIVIAAALTVVVVRRWKSARGLTRAALTPVLVGGVIVAAFGALFFVIALTLRTELPLSGQVLLLLRLLVPVGLVLVLLRFYNARSEVARTLVRMGRGTTLGGLQAALRASLRDPEMTIGRWSPSTDAYIDADGREVDTVTTQRDRAVLDVQSQEKRLAAVVYDRAMDSDRELLEVVAEAVRHTLGVTDMRDELSARGGDVSRLPQGDVTFLFGDVEASTELLSRLGDAYAEVLTLLRRHVRRSADQNAGHVVDMRADECFLAFGRPLDALAAALGLQVVLAETDWPGGLPLRLRIGLHTGRPRLTADGYVGLDVHRAARVMGAAKGGQIMASEPFARAVEDRLPAGVSLVPAGPFVLHGLPDPEMLFGLAQRTE